MDEKNELVVKEETQLEKLSLAEELALDIEKAQDENEFQQCLDKFNLFLKKNNALGIINNVQTLKMLNQKAQERAMCGDMEDRDVVSYIKVINDQINQGKQTIGDVIQNAPTIQINQQNNNVVLRDDMPEESKEKVIEVGKKLLELLKKEKEGNVDGNQK